MLNTSQQHVKWDTFRDTFSEQTFGFAVNWNPRIQQIQRSSASRGLARPSHAATCSNAARDPPTGAPLCGSACAAPPLQPLARRAAVCSRALGHTEETRGRQRLKWGIFAVEDQKQISTISISISILLQQYLLYNLSLSLLLVIGFVAHHRKLTNHWIRSREKRCSGLKRPGLEHRGAASSWAIHEAFGFQFNTGHHLGLKYSDEGTYFKRQNMF